MRTERRPGKKKGAHYSVPPPRATFAGTCVAAGRAGGQRRAASRGGGLLAGCLFLGGLLALPCAAVASPATSRPQAARRAEGELQAVKSEIERVSREVTASEVERDRLTRDLRAAELSVGKARAALSGVRRQRSEHAAQRAALQAEQREREVELERNRAALAGQLRAAYLIGRQEPLELLLNQEDLARAGRMLVYYGYFGRARAGEIQLIAGDVQRLGQLEQEVDAEDAQLAQLETQRRAQLGDLERSREQRSQALAGLEAEAHTRAQNLARLRAQRAGLEKLVRELRAAVARYPLETNDAFARLRGRLAWPVSGRLVARFGEARAGGVRWDGVLVATERGAPVKAVYAGRVIYADWLPGLGLLTIIDHGDGYLSLYGHNERLYKAVGEQVAAGDTIAAAGDSGGSSRPELYFEIRKGGKPVDPRPWFRAPDP